VIICAGWKAATHVAQLVAPAVGVHVEEHHRVRPAFLGVHDEAVHRAVGRGDVGLELDHRHS
jgi:hypothetical protein